jgi:hypothetical protein
MDAKLIYTKQINQCQFGYLKFEKETILEKNLQEMILLDLKKFGIVGSER